MDEKSNHDDERMMILRMVEEGKISASDAASLLSALNSRGVVHTSEPAVADLRAPNPPTSLPTSDQQTELSTSSAPDESAQWLRVRVTDMTSGRTKVTVNLPISLVNWGMKIGARYAPEVSEFNFNELSQMLKSGAEGKLIDVMDEEDGEHVEIFID